MTPGSDPQFQLNEDAGPPANLDEAALPPAEPDEAQRQQQLWRLYREQQERLTCPGCGDEGAIF